MKSLGLDSPSGSGGVPSCGGTRILSPRASAGVRKGVAPSSLSPPTTQRGPGGCLSPNPNGQEEVTLTGAPGGPGRPRGPAGPWGEQRGSAVSPCHPVPKHPPSSSPPHCCTHRALLSPHPPPPAVLISTPSLSPSHPLPVPIATLSTSCLVPNTYHHLSPLSPHLCRHCPYCLSPLPPHPCPHHQPVPNSVPVSIPTHSLSLLSLHPCFCACPHPCFHPCPHPYTFPVSAVTPSLSLSPSCPQLCPHP